LTFPPESAMSPAAHSEKLGSVNTSWARK
jgi:hypothetical protein